MNHTSEPQGGGDPFDLERFVAAQDGVYESALRELKRGRKESHWMWFIFPQVDGLGSSPTARRYSIKSIDEARAYLNHPILGPRLLECSEVLAKWAGRSVSDIFGYPDDLKLRSSMTLFAAISAPDSVFAKVLKASFEGQPDRRTLDLLEP